LASVLPKHVGDMFLRDIKGVRLKTIACNE